jgi:hypothetical protein
MSREGDIRRHDRATKSAGVQLVWKDRGGVDKFMQGSTIDISESGMRIEVREAIEKQTYVTLQSVPLGLHGTASVRSCTRKGTKFVLGLEFSGGLRWKPRTSGKP